MMSCESNGIVLSAFFKYHEEIRILVYTTSPIKSVNNLLEKLPDQKCILHTNESALMRVAESNLDL